MIQTSSSNVCGDRSVRVRIDLAGSDGLEEMKVDKIEPQKNFSRDSASCSLHRYCYGQCDRVYCCLCLRARRPCQERVLRFLVARGFHPESPTLHTTSLQCVRWACHGNVCSIASMLVSGHRSATYARNFMYGLWGLHPLPKWQRVSTYVDSAAAHRLARWEVWAALLDCLAFGTYFPAGVALTEPPRRWNRPAVLLAVYCVSVNQQHPTARDLGGQARQAAVRGCGP